jgi:hypothetical protein
MTAVSAYLEGARRVGRAPLLLAGTLVMSLLVAAPLTFAVRSAIAEDLGNSTAADLAAAGVNWEWWQEFSSRASGLARSFQPSVIGFAAPLRNFSDLADGNPPGPALRGAIAVWLIVWTFLSGGILDRLARNRVVRAHGFFMACGGYFFRFVRIGLLALAAYAVLSLLVHGWLFADFYTWMTRSLTVERQAFLLRLGLYGAAALLFAALSVVLDYARIRIVVEDRRSVLAAITASARFVRRHAGKVALLYVLNLLTFGGLLAAYALVAPGAGRAGWEAWLALVLGQLFVAARLGIKFMFLASQTALFQGHLAHTGYVAGAPARWPESPMAEAIRRA